MAIKDLKISEAQVSQKGVVSAPDKLSGSAAENKAVFDRLVKDVIVPNYNALLDTLAGLGGAWEIGAAVDGLKGSNVQTLLTNLKKHTDETVINVGAMSSFNGRNGAVVPKEGDYNADQITETERQFTSRTEKAVWNQIVPHADDTAVHHLLSEILLAVYPVGSVYITTSPDYDTKEKMQNHFGGIWEEWGQGRVPVGIDAAQSEFNEINKTGGRKTAQLIAAIGVANNNASNLGWISSESKPWAGKYQYGISATPVATVGIETGTAIFDGFGNRDISWLSPYITCYMWKRTA